MKIQQIKEQKPHKPR